LKTKELIMDTLMQSPFTGCTTKAGLAAGTTTTLTWANAVIGAIAGKAYTKAAASNQATPTTDATTGAAFLPVPVGVASVANGQGGYTDGYGYGCVFVVGFNAAGTLKVAQGSIEKTDSVAVANSKFTTSVPKFPALPDDFYPVGYIVTRTDSTATAWTFGSSNLAGPPTGVVHTYVDTIGYLPGRPQVS
jgi:hypothetical protein